MAKPSARRIVVAPYNANGNKGDEELTEQALGVARTLGAESPGVLVEPSAPQYRSRGGVPTHSVAGFMRYPLAGPGGRHLALGAFAADTVALGAALLLGRSARRLPLGRRRRRCLEALVDSDLVLFKGGGYCHTYGSPRDAVALLYLLHVALLCRRTGTPYSFLPNSYGPFRTPGTAPAMRYVLRGARVVLSRESASTDALAELDPSREVVTSPDMAFAITPDDGAPVDAALGPVVSDGSRPVVGITARPVRPSEADDVEVATDRYLDALRGVVRHVRERGGTPVLVTHVRDENEGEDDRRVLRRLQEVDGEAVAWVDEPELSAPQLAALYGRLDLLVATRFHSTIFAAAAGTPSVVLSYGGNKAQGSLRDMGLDHFSVDQVDADGDDLVALVDEALDTREDLTAVVQEWARASRDANRRVTEMLADAHP